MRLAESSTHCTLAPPSDLEMLSLESDHYRHLPHMYHADAIRDMDIRPNVNSLDLASPPPSRQAMRNSQPLTPPITPARRVGPSSRPLPRFIPVIPPHDESTPHSLPSPAASITDERPSSQLFLRVQDGSTLPTRYLVVTGLPPDIPAKELTRVFSRLGDLKGIFVRFQQKSGVIILSFHDLRHAVRAHRTISNQALFGLGAPCSAAFITPDDLIMSTGESPFVGTTEGNLRVVAVPLDPNNPPAESITLHAAIAVFGEVAALRTQRDPSTNTTTYYATFYDAREAARAVTDLNGRSVLGHILHVSSPNLDIRYTDVIADHNYLALPVSNDGAAHINFLESSRLSAVAPDEPDRDLESGPPPSPVVPGVHRLHVEDSRCSSYGDVYRSSVGSSSASRVSAMAPAHVLALDFDGGDLNISSTNHPPTEVYSTGPALQAHRDPVEDEEVARCRASPIGGVEASSKSASPFIQPAVLSSAMAPPTGSSESYHIQRGLPSHVVEAPHSANAVRHYNGQASCGESPSATRSRVLPPRLSLPWLAQQSANTISHQYAPTVSPYTPSPYVEHDPSFTSVHAPNSVPYYGYHGHPLPQYPQHPLSLPHAHPQHKYSPYPPSPYHYYGLGYYPPPPSAAYTTPTATASLYSLSEGPSPISTSPEVRTPALSKRGSVASLASVGAMSMSGSSASGGGRSAVSVDESLGGGEHATPTLAAHVPMHGGGKALLLDMARAARPPNVPMMGTISTPPNPNPVTNPEKNAVDIAKIEAGLDTRTTVMLKNVPNKMSSSELQRFIWNVVPKSFDFMYLRFDFSSSANVGYAFVNFIDVQDLLLFAKTKLGVKWNMYSSDKVLQMSYANFQGKEALVEKFKNSCVMEMQDEWVPKIFYTSGPNHGQREPFPTPSNVSRTRRSADQRERGILRAQHLMPYHPSRGHGRHMRVE